MSSEKTKYHFIGLGGIGMSAIARILLQKGHQVQGSDAVENALLQQLREEGAIVQIGHSEEVVQLGFSVVYGSGIREENVEFLQAKKLNVPLLHRADLLDQLMEGKRALLVTGTHGKTTTSALLASVFLEEKLDPTFAIGGILRALNTNGKRGEGSYFIAEADESDGSFLKTHAFGAIVTNVESEHLDYWKNEESLLTAFRMFCSQVKNREHFFWCADDPRLHAMELGGFSYGFSEKAHLRISSYKPRERGISFDVVFQGNKYSRVELSLNGRHNALNGAAVFGLALSLGISEKAIRNAFEKFSGTQRRLELKGEKHHLRVYDDYAHHPTEIAATLKSLREREKERRLIALFQPHRFTRVRDHLDSFLDSFHEADEVILTDIYSAGEAPIEGITSAVLYTRMREKLGSKVHFLPKGRLEQDLAERLGPLDVVITLGAGDVTRVGEPLLHHFAQRAPKLTVGILCGGTSAEHSVSLMSARNFAQALDSAIYTVKLFGITKEGDWIYGSDAIDQLEQKQKHHFSHSKIAPDVLKELLTCEVCIPVFHGPQGEDGMFQGFLDTLGIPYVGCDYRSSALCMQKSWSKQIAIQIGVPTLPFVEMDFPTFSRNPELLLKKIEENIGYPVWIKAVHLGSSIGVARAAGPEEVHRAAANAFAVDDMLIAEKEVKGREIEFAVLGNEFIRVADPCEILNYGVFYELDKKYGPNAMGVEIPANLTPLQRQIGSELAERIYIAAGCKGLTRVDFFLDAQGHFWFNELNPLPGFTNTSGYPKAWEASGLTQRQLLDELIALALQKSRRLTAIRGK